MSVKYGEELKSALTDYKPLKITDYAQSEEVETKEVNLSLLTQVISNKIGEI